jgi:hypothetical protein
MTPNRMLLNVYSISLKKRKENMQKKKQLKYLILIAVYYIVFTKERFCSQWTSEFAGEYFSSICNPYLHIQQRIFDFKAKISKWMLLNVYSISLKKRKENMPKKNQLKYLIYKDWHSVKYVSRGMFHWILNSSSVLIKGRLLM